MRSRLATVGTILALVGGTGGAIAIAGQGSSGGPLGGAASAQYCKSKSGNCGHHKHQGHHCNKRGRGRGNGLCKGHNEHHGNKGKHGHKGKNHKKGSNHSKSGGKGGKLHCSDSKVLGVLVTFCS